MRRLHALTVVLFFAASANMQPLAAQSIEGYWQDIAGRITFKRNPLPADTYGGWYERALDQTYPAAKYIRKVGESFELVDLNYDEKDYPIRVLKASAQRIDYVRAMKWSQCQVNHACQLKGSELTCAMEHVCREDGRETVELRAEERFIRRNSCARTQARPEAQGFPVACR